jgi:hypothetical protein
VKRSGRDEPIQLVIHICMEAMLGISLYTYLYLKLTKAIVFSSTKLKKLADQVLPRSEGSGGEGGDGRQGGDGPSNVCSYE